MLRILFALLFISMNVFSQKAEIFRIGNSITPIFTISGDFVYEKNNVTEDNKIYSFSKTKVYRGSTSDPSMLIYTIKGNKIKDRYDKTVYVLRDSTVYRVSKGNPDEFVFYFDGKNIYRTDKKILVYTVKGYVPIEVLTWLIGDY